MMKKPIASVLALVLAAVLICVGIFTNQPEAVHTKASTICLECIGIG